MNRQRLNNIKGDWIKSNLEYIYQHFKYHRNLLK